MYLFLTLDPCNCWWLHMDLPPSWVQRFHCRKWCDVKSCARDQLVTSWKGSAGIFSTKNSSERSLDSALRYRIHIRPSPIAKLPPNPLLPLFFGPTPKPLSWPKHLGSRVAFYLGTKLHFFRSDVGQSWKRKNFHRLGLMFLPSKRQKSIYGFPHGFYAQNGDFLCVFFFCCCWGCYGSKKISIHKKMPATSTKNRLGSRLFFKAPKNPNISRPFASRRPRPRLGHVSSWESARNGCGNEQGRGIAGIHGYDLMVDFIRVSKKDLHLEDGENDDHQQEVYFANIRTSLLKCNPRMNTTKRTSNLMPVEFQWWSFDRPKFWIQISVCICFRKCNIFKNGKC